jgi:hypothetical protein
VPTFGGATPIETIAAGGYEQAMSCAQGLTYGAFT